MINKYVAMGLGALIALAPVVASVEVAQAATRRPRRRTHTGRIAARSPQDQHVRAPRARFGSSHAQDATAPQGSEELIDEIRAVWGARTRCEGGRVIAAPFV